MPYLKQTLFVHADRLNIKTVCIADENGCARTTEGGGINVMLSVTPTRERMM